MLDLVQHPHRRLNALTGEWVLVSPHRTARPWQGQVEKTAAPAQLQYDPGCYLCPGNERAGGARNPQYSGTFVFTNDFAALYPEVPLERVDVSGQGLMVAEGEPGTCAVMCFSPRHDLTLSTMQVPDIRGVVDVWAEQYSELGSRAAVNHVQIFENRGAMMGASNPHPHCQIWASATLPNEGLKETAAQQAHRQASGSCLLCDYLKLEAEAGERIIFENDAFVVLVPYWAVWPFETLLLGKRHTGSLPELTSAERDGLAGALRRMTARYDNLFSVSFPYSMGFHQSPTDGQAHPEWHLHAHFYPPLLRSATVRKFMVGFELLGTPQRDLTPEAAAQRLREIPE